MLCPLSYRGLNLIVWIVGQEEVLQCFKCHVAEEVNQQVMLFIELYHILLPFQ